MEKDTEIKNKGLPDGSSDWILTFSDLMILLLCFFILLLSFSRMDEKKFRTMAGSMEKAFGVRRTETKIEFADQGLLDMKKELVRVLEIEIAERFDSEKDLIDLQIEGNDLVIRLMGETAFDSGKADIRTEMKPILVTLGGFLRKKENKIIIGGHTDDVPISGGPYESNLVLSMARAASVAKFLIEVVDIHPRRVATMGFGEYHPIESNETVEGRKKNRRVEIIVTGRSLY